MNRNRKVTFRVSEEELNEIEEKAAKGNISPSEFCRRCCQGKKITVIEGLKDFQKELRHIGVNLNQLTILCHQGRITSLSLEKTEKELSKIWQSLNSLITQSKQRQD